MNEGQMVIFDTDGTLMDGRHAIIDAVAQGQRHFVQIYAVDPGVEVGKLGGHPRVELDDLELATLFVHHDLHVEEAVVETDRPQEPRGDRLGLPLQRFGEAARIVPAHKGIGAGIHHGVDDPQTAHVASETVAVQTVLSTTHALLEHQTVCRPGLGQTLLNDPLKGFHQVLDHPKLTKAEAGMSA